MKQTIALKLGQSLTMTPALQQAIKMLQLSTLDLQTEIQDALESNLMLEREEAEAAGDEAPATRETQATGEDIPEALPVDADWDDIYPAAPAPAAPRNPDDDALHDYQQANLHTPPDLHEHLSWQADLHPFDERQRLAAAHLIDAIDERGYLCDWPQLSAHLTDSLGMAQTDVDNVLASLQEFDPPGVAARDLAECLQLQLRQLAPDTPGHATARALADERLLPLLAAGDHVRLRRQLDVDETTLGGAISLIRQLAPHPGDAYDAHQSRYVVPEVFVRKHQGRWQVSLNPDIAPRLRINATYEALIRRADNSANSADKATMREHLQQARFFLNSLKSRNDTLLRVAEAIVEAQRAFMEYGEEAMKPLVLRDVADGLDIHESTVSRATANKYMQTPRGLYELKYFFSSHVATIDGGTCSATAIQAMIKRLVADEAPAKPLSDAKLAECLLDEGIQVARRTVAKYRESMNIAPSHQRRKRAG